MLVNNNQARRFHRIKLDASVALSNQSGQTMLCQCIELSEDSLELEPLQQASLLDEFRVKAGDIVQVQINQMPNAPKLAAAVVKISPQRIGLRLLATETDSADA